MTYLENLLATVFSGDVGLSDRGVKAALNAIRDNPDQRQFEGLREELQSMFADSSTDWMRLLDNEDYEVIHPASQDAAKTFILENVWKLLFSAL